MLPGHRVTENPKCLAPLQRGSGRYLARRAAPSPQGGEFPQTPCLGPRSPRGTVGEWAHGPSKSMPKVTLTSSLCQNRPQCFPSHPPGVRGWSPPPCVANLTLVITLNLYLLRSFCAQGTSVTCHFLANFSECQLCARPTQFPRSHHLPDPAASLWTVGTRMQVSGGDGPPCPVLASSPGNGS